MKCSDKPDFKYILINQYFNDLKGLNYIRRDDLIDLESPKLHMSHHEDHQEETCLICSSETRTALFKSCNHIISCTSCSSQQRFCLLCKEPVLKVIRIDKCMSCKRNKASLLTSPCKDASCCQDCSIAHKYCVQCHSPVDRYIRLTEILSQIDREYAFYLSSKNGKLLSKSNFEQVNQELKEK